MLQTLLGELIDHGSDELQDIWMFRQQFINQLAIVSFMNYVMHMANRLLHTQ
jgi:hypothetical protein